MFTLLLITLFYVDGYCIKPGYVGARITLMNGYNLPFLSSGCGLDWPTTSILEIPVIPERDSTFEFTAYSKEKNWIIFSLTVENEWKNPEDHLMIYNTTKKYGINYDKLLILDKAEQELKEICLKMTINEIVSDKFPELNEHLEKYLQDENDKINSGIKIIWVRISQPVIDASIMKSYQEIVQHETEARAFEKKREKDAISNQIASDKQASNDLIERKTAHTRNQIASDKADSDRQIATIKAEADRHILIENAKATREKSLIDLEVTLKTAEVYYQKGLKEVDISERLWGIENYAKAEIAGKTFPNARILGADSMKLLLVPENNPIKDNIVDE